MKAALKVLGRNKSLGVDGILIKLFQATETESVKILTICQQIWKTKQWPTDWKCSKSILILKKGDGKEYSNYRTILSSSLNYYVYKYKTAVLINLLVVTLPHKTIMKIT